VHRIAVALIGAALATVGLADPRQEASIAPMLKASSGPLLGIVRREESSQAKLVRVDPRLLRPIGKRFVPLPGASGAWSFSPARSQLVVPIHSGLRSGRPKALLRFVEPSKLRVIRTLALGPGGVESVAWLARDRVLALRHEELVVVDSAAGRIIARKAFDGYIVHVARSARYLVVLTASQDSIAPARLFVFDDRGNSRRVLLSEIGAGAHAVNEVSTHRQPGLAVDPEHGRAYVVSPEGLVADVDLNAVSVVYRTASERRSLLARLRNWLEPEAQAKASSGPRRHAQWLGNGVIGVSGVDDQAYELATGFLHMKEQGAGVKVIDTRSWTIRTFDSSADFFSSTSTELLATASLWDSLSQSFSGIGLRAYAFDGSRRFELFAGKPARVDLVFRGRAYVRIGNDRALRIVDLRRGRVVGTWGKPLPALLLGQASDFWR
jgi:hypothetical protein